MLVSYSRRLAPAGKARSRTPIRLVITAPPAAPWQKANSPRDAASRGRFHSTKAPISRIAKAVSRLNPVLRRDSLAVIRPTATVSPRVWPSAPVTASSASPTPSSAS